MKDQILQTLSELRTYALHLCAGKPGYEISLFYHEEQSSLMRFANSAISLNTNERLVRLEITAYSGKKRASYELITDLNKFAEMQQGIETALEMVEHVQPLEYQPTIPVFIETFADKGSYDPAMAAMTSAEKLDYFNKAIQDLETADLLLSGIFSSGVNTLAQINTRSDHSQFFSTTDAQVTVVLAHNTAKWEVQAEQSAYKKSELDAAILRDELVFLIDHYQNDNAQQLPLGKYDVIFGPAATADMLVFMNWVGFDGGALKRGYSFLHEDQVGAKIFSDIFTLLDDPSQPETFPFKKDFTGIPRDKFPIIEGGVFRGFTWTQDDADEYRAPATGHTVSHKSLVIQGGDQNIDSLSALVNRPRPKDLLYIPFLHYMNFVNPSKGIVTGSSRFGALLLKKDGSVVIPYNVRLTQSLLDIFGDKLTWATAKTVPYNTSQSYGARNPTAVIVPQFVCVSDLEISHANASF